MTRRVLIGLALAIVGIGSVWYPTAFAVVVLIIALTSLRELARLSARKGQELVFPVAALAVVAYIVLARYGILRGWETVLLGATIVGSLAVALFGSRSGYFARAAYTLLGVLYIGKLLSYFVTLRNVPESGAMYTVAAIVLIAMSDISCMFVGKALGRTPLTPISPQKTVEGAVGGLVVVTAVGGLLTLVPHSGIPLWQGLAIGAVTGFAAQIGDLVESALKRDASVKDTGTGLAGHGGWLDRFDSYLFGGIAFYAVMHVLGHIPGAGD